MYPTSDVEVTSSQVKTATIFEKEHTEIERLDLPAPAFLEVRKAPEEIHRDVIKGIAKHLFLSDDA